MLGIETDFPFLVFIFSQQREKRKKHFFCCPLNQNRHFLAFLGVSRHKVYLEERILTLLETIYFMDKSNSENSQKTQTLYCNVIWAFTF